jgi:hypothetical protein
MVTMLGLSALDMTTISITDDASSVVETTCHLFCLDFEHCDCQKNKGLCSFDPKHL